MNVTHTNLPARSLALGMINDTVDLVSFCSCSLDMGAYYLPPTKHSQHLQSDKAEDCRLLLPLIPCYVPTIAFCIVTWVQERCTLVCSLLGQQMPTMGECVRVHRPL